MSADVVQAVDEIFYGSSDAIVWMSERDIRDAMVQIMENARVCPSVIHQVMEQCAGYRRCELLAAGRMVVLTVTSRPSGERRKEARGGRRASDAAEEIQSPLLRALLVKAPSDVPTRRQAGMARQLVEEHMCA